MIKERAKINFLTSCNLWNKSIYYKDSILAISTSLDYFNYHNLIELNINLTSKQEIRKLNYRFLKKDSETNILAFPSLKEFKIKNNKRRIFVGDLAISYEVTKRESVEQSKSFNDHFIHLIIHAFLHLLGYSHYKKKDAFIMENHEKNILKVLGIKNPYDE